jgi:hypothetical protein
MMPADYEPATFPYTAPGPRPSLPETGNFVEAVRKSCREATEASAPDIVLGDQDSIDSFVRGLDVERWEKLTARAPAMLQELNYVSLLGYLQIGSGYRTELKKLTGRGAAESITFGMISVFISG